jgi:hypothetical protein
MPMRGTLPLRNSSLNDFRETKSVDDAVLLLINSPDFIAIAAFAAVGILASLWLALAQPGTIETMALFAQTT